MPNSFKPSRMKTTTTWMLMLFVLLTACQQTKPTDNPELLKAVLINYFEGIKAHDISTMNAATTSDFVLYEDGKIWNNDSLMRELNKFPGYKGEFKLENLNIAVDQISGSIRYLNHGDFVLNDTTKLSFNWIESANFVKKDESWKINFLHSTVRK
jgi:hypothetical protein